MNIYKGKELRFLSSQPYVYYKECRILMVCNPSLRLINVLHVDVMVLYYLVCTSKGFTVPVYAPNSHENIK